MSNVSVSDPFAQLEAPKVVMPFQGAESCRGHGDE